MAHKKNKSKHVQPVEQKTVAEIIGLPVPDENKPEGMAFILGAGVVDPRKGGYPDKLHPNQQWALIQSWAPTSKLWWDLGLRWHPELATKWLKGGGQFGLSEICNEPPPAPPTIEEVAQEFVDDQFPNMMKEVERIRDHGTEVEKAQLRKQLETSQAQITAMAQNLEQE